MPSSLRAASRLVPQASSIARSSQRLGQVQRHFSSSRSCPQQIQDAYILSAARTPTAKFNGAFVSVSAPELGAVAIKAAIEKSRVPVEKIKDVYMGNVLSASAVTINKVCAFGTESSRLRRPGHPNLGLGLRHRSPGGSVEHVQGPLLRSTGQASNRPFGNVTMEDGLIKDGLWDVYEQFHMGVCAEQTAKKYNISREQQDEYAIQSYKRAQKAWAEDKFADEIAVVTVKGKKGDTSVSRDDGFENLREDKLKTLKPAFVRDGTGTVTAGNASTFNDGASALVLTNKELAQKYGSGNRVLARIVSSADAALDPVDFPVAPAKAVPIALERAGLTKDQISIWEFNEAFASVIKANEKILGLENAVVNPLGGAISIGHALGSSGSRILTTLLHQLKPGQYGLAAICNGGGAATAVIVQRLESVE
ncbi:hypothetical protein PABG_07114 [Paracoccidioides brasiliensis Pb03]|nr:hypothetical protein PABG_07114 [Paracoccidioides brasiliensis Pb03]